MEIPMSKAAGFNLFTIGYESHTPESLIAALRKAKIKTLIDVRDLPLSRKRGFSKSPLRSLLEEHDIRYVHVKGFGVPADLRHQYRAGEVKKVQYMECFRSMLANGGELLEEAYSMAKSERCCLMCMEEHHADCHRTVVAAEIAKVNGLAVRIVHL
jgi:uncharacterized protein (DUF488 family)